MIVDYQSANGLRQALSVCVQRPRVTLGYSWMKRICVRTLLCAKGSSENGPHCTR